MGFHDFVDTVKKVTGLSDKPKVSNAEYVRRMTICKACPNYFKPLTQCLLCGCVMPEKSKYVEDHCDIKKW